MKIKKKETLKFYYIVNKITKEQIPDDCDGILVDLLTGVACFFSDALHVKALELSKPCIYIK